METLDLVSVIEAAVETVQPAADEKAITIERRLDADIGLTAGDPARLQQVIWNLLSNAVKFTPRNGRIQIVLRSRGAEAEILIIDNGVGIRPDFLPYIFDRFQQADRSRSRRFGGLGLGLSIVKKLVELHGGSVTAESAGEGRGTTFTVAFPLQAPTKLRERALAPASTRQPIAANVRLANIRVLVVEDEPDTAEFVRHLLEPYGADVVLAESGPLALTALATTKPDILISDIGLPEMDGYELIERIRRNDVGHGGGIPAVALTAFARSEDRMRAMLAGYQAYLTKPVEPSELVATVASFAELVLARRADRPDR
jgi:CheY-like chemotaxis protein/anti-sigma regulatory factor (Ser/Thr protein kinase)